MIALAWLVYIPLQILWLPISLLGVMWVAYKQIAVSQRMGVSQTAVEIINGRWTMDVFGLRRDEPARKLASAIPNNSIAGLWLTLFPLWLARQIAGEPFLYPTLPSPENAGLANLVPSRTMEFDALISANSDTADQLVVLGAGLDTRVFGALNQNIVSLFELDQKAMQAYKREHLKKADIETTKVQFVEVDFADPDWITGLMATSYNPKKRTIFLWEGVTLYLSESAVQNTLVALKSQAAPGSVVLADFYSQHFVNMSKGKAVNNVLEATGESLNLGLDFSDDAEAALRAFISSQGLALGRHQFLGGGDKKGPFMVIAELSI
jgi:methyltransferase (TIGR00027 family)